MLPERPMPVPTAIEISRRMWTTVGAGRGELCDGLEGERLERIAGENCDGFSERDVAGWAGRGAVIVVERGQVVVDERVGVQHLERAPNRRRLRAVHGPQRPCAASMQRMGAQPLAAGRRRCGAWRGGWSGATCRSTAGGVRARRR